ncbi:alpha/beta hydrolase [Agrobacterium tumefaciens]|uniref:alpha/beta fold hydrolase n=1 Tax=Agrobacterium tumefaciens TaxID=358 RepID=UPI001573BCF8|nr:alpha/beta hydrolase [Agrobacterium tumefaciens]NTB99212.1 alpha/beta hydrolase [Agrobacterium tumefaciens]NTC46892.1 alpha/beta hydrolase [Agrobacterium tumefaciens]
MKRQRAGVLNVAYYESGPITGEPIILLHGFPYDILAFEQVVRQLSHLGKRCIVPYLRGYGPTRFLSPATPRSGEQAALGADLIALMDALHIDRAILAGFDWGGRAACVVSALWPERVRGLLSCGSGYNIQDIANAGEPITPEQEFRFWYQYYLHSERGHAGLLRTRQDFCHLLWSLWSPSWRFDAITFANTSTSFNNPDFVEVVVHSYRHRFGLVGGDPSFDLIERRLATQPKISVPTIVLQGKDDGVDPPTMTDDRNPHFTGFYQHRLLSAVGHNVPQEAPDVFVETLLELSK